MRIALDARIADYTVGGIARYTTLLASALAEMAGGHELIALRAARPKVTAPEIPGWGATRVRTPPHHRFERYTLPLEVRGLKPDILHSPDFVAPRSFGWRRIVTVHDLAFLRMPWLVTGDARRHYSGVRQAVRDADAVIAVSHATALDLVDLLDAPADKVHVVYEAAAPGLAPMPREEAARLVRERHGVEQPYILFVGTLEPRKNVPLLLEAYKLLRRECPAHLVLVGGRGWLSDDVFETAQKLALADGVSILGAVDPSELRPLYCAAEVLAMPSLYEGFGLPPLEAMACGTPVVVSNAASLTEIVADAAVVVRPEDPHDIANGLGWVLTNQAFRATLVERGLARAAEFSWRRAAEETMAIYEAVAAA